MLRSHPLATLAVAHLGRLLPPRHAAVAVVARLRLSVRVSSLVAVVAALRLAVVRSQRLGASVPPPPVAGVSRTVAVRHLTKNWTYTGLIGRA